MYFETFLTIIAALGTGSIITAIVAHVLGKGKEIDFKKLEQKEKRYRSVMAYMYGYLEPNHRRFIDWDQSVQTKDEIIMFLKTQYHDMLFFASKNVLLEVKKFIISPNYNNFLSTMIEMRADLWIGKKDLKIEETIIDLPTVKNK